MVLVKLHKSHNNPGAVFVQNVKDSNLAVKMKIYYCNSAFFVVSYNQVEAIQTTQAEAIDGKNGMRRQLTVPALCRDSRRQTATYKRTITKLFYGGNKNEQLQFRQQ